MATYNRRSLAHVWASQDKAEGKGSNFFFEGPTIFSYGYHFPIATFVTNKQGQRAVLFTTRTYSNTTASHKSAARSALHGLGVPVFYVVLNSNNWREPNIHHQEHLKSFKTDIQEASLELGNARKKVGPILERIQKAVTAHNEYAEFFGYKARLKMPTNIDELREKAAKELEKDKKREEARVEANKQKVEAARLEREANRQKWLAGEDVYYNAVFDEETRLRVVEKPFEHAESDNENEVAATFTPGQMRKWLQSTRGAEVPLDHATKLLPLIRSGEAREFNGDGLKVGHWRVKQITSEGDIVVGCHTIKRAEIERLASSLGL